MHAAPPPVLWLARPADSALEIKFLRENLVKGEVGQLDKDANLITGKRANRRPKRGTPVTLSLTWKDGETQSMTTVPLTTYDLGRKVGNLITFIVLKYSIY